LRLLRRATLRIGTTIDLPIVLEARRPDAIASGSRCT
jgi:hypothetical protein